MTNSPADLTTVEGANAWILDVKREAVERFRKDGALTARALVLAMRDERSGLALPQPRQVVVFVDPTIMELAGAGKDKLALWLRRMVRINDAIGYAFVMESWVLQDVDIRPAHNWANVPGRTEAITIMVQHKALGPETMAFHRPITRDKSGSPKLGSWTRGTGARGRFTGVLPSPEDEADVSRALEGMLANGADMTPEQRRYHMERALERAVAGGIPQTAADALFRKIAAKLAEAGQPVAPRPQDIVAAASEANDAGATIDVVDVDEWGK